MTLAEPTSDMTERKCFSNVLTARVLKSLNLNLNGLLVTRQFDNTSPGVGWGGERQEGN